VIQQIFLSMKLATGEKRADPTSSCRYGAARACGKVSKGRVRDGSTGVCLPLCAGAADRKSIGAASGVCCFLVWPSPRLRSQHRARRPAKSIKDSCTLKAVDHLFRTRPISRNDFTLSALSPPNLGTLASFCFAEAASGQAARCILRRRKAGAFL